MFSLLSQLLRSSLAMPMGVHMREALTPGHLYRLMSAEFRAFRSRQCSCVMPMVFTCTPAHPRACNWSVRALASSCPSCQPLVDEVVARHAAVYNVNDPTYVPPPTGDANENGDHFPLFS